MLRFKFQFKQPTSPLDETSQSAKFRDAAYYWIQWYTHFVQDLHLLLAL